MNNGLYLQKLKIQLYPMNSFNGYSLLIKNDVPKGKEKQAIFDIYDEVREGFYTTKFDSINLLIDKFWNQDEYGFDSFAISKFNCEDYLQKLCISLSKKYLYLKNGSLYVDGNKRRWDSLDKYDDQIEIGENYNNKFQWYYLKHLIDTDILVAAFMADNDFNSYGSYKIWRNSIQTTNTLLDKVLDDGVAELHMHLNAGKRFLAIWTDLMNDTNNKRGKTKDSLLKKITTNTSEGKISLEHYIKVAKIIRVLMAAYISSEKQEITKIKDFIKELDKNKLKDTKNCNNEEDIICNNGKIDFSKICNELINGEKFHNRNDIYFNSYFNKLMEIYELNYEVLKRNGESLIFKDIITHLFSEFYGIDYGKNETFIKNGLEYDISPEHILLTKCFLKLNKNKDEWFSKLFWQYIKIKNLVYKFFIQQNTCGKGLDVFSSIYSRQGQFGSEAFFQEIFSRHTDSGIMKKMEVRIGPDINEERARKTLANIFKGYKKVLLNTKHNNVPLIGITYHFIKRKQDLKDSCYYLYSTKNNERYNYYGSLENKYYEESKVISKLRSEIPYLDNYIVGIDAASKENDTEPYVFIKAYNNLRSNVNSSYKNHLQSGFKKDIGFTFHVGEEYRDIISGLRHVDEVIEKLKFRAGDRLGHAIVIGIDIDKWASINPIVYLTLGEYFENLLWEWGLYVEDYEYRDTENIAFIENKIMEAAEMIFGFTEGITVRELYKNYLKKFKTIENHICPREDKCFLIEHSRIKEEVKKDNHYFSEENINWTPLSIYAALNCKYFLKNIKKTISININSDVVVKYKKLQEYMKKKISNRGIIIETNPTSNLMIGDFARYEDYHILNMSSPEKEDVIVTINTDDPVIFNTMIKDEFALIYDILMKDGRYPNKEIIKWLDKIRVNGLKYSFIEDRGLNKYDLKKEIELIIKELEK
ncbi:hypothetical protein [Oceanirhabdus sp. W0125-5]|uniref:hypothetical protein n=1 Tax=Oceanirhabdus sp. W0125-5 TaxID=2999116 RepID=UPI0022F3065D|nr:hypothetical protein [Oceanirhabdus sp. W0125-5]WBW96307.1 hypothetical protein OW730_21825 [Oceanirhabdus sp. W0125-5]